MVTVIPFMGTMPNIMSTMPSMARIFASAIGPSSAGAGLMEATSNSGKGASCARAAAHRNAAKKIPAGWRMATN